MHWYCPVQISYYFQAGLLNVKNSGSCDQLPMRKLEGSPMILSVTTLPEHFLVICLLCGLEQQQVQYYSTDTILLSVSRAIDSCEQEPSCKIYSSDIFTLSSVFKKINTFHIKLPTTVQQSVQKQSVAKISVNKSHYILHILERCLVIPSVRNRAALCIKCDKCIIIALLTNLCHAFALGMSLYIY